MLPREAHIEGLGLKYEYNSLNWTLESFIEFREREKEFKPTIKLNIAIG